MPQMTTPPPLPSEGTMQTILKLLALADPASGATAEEAKSAWAKAQKLITKYQIDMASLEEAKGVMKDKQGHSFNIGEDFVATGRVMRVDFERNIATILTKCFGVQVIWCTESSTGRKRHAYYLVGDQFDRAIAKAVYPILYSAMFAGVRRLLKEMSEAKGYTVKWTADIGRSYYDGVTYGYVHMSEQGKAAAIAAAKKADADAFAIVLVDKDNAICAHMAKKFPDLKTVKDKRQAEFDREAFARGTVDGQALDLKNNNKLTA